MASLHSLPAPLPLYLAKALPDLKALDGLRRSSTVYATVFSQHAVEILEHLMLATLHSDLVVEIRAYVLLLARRNRWRRTEDALEHLHEKAQAPLEKDTPTESVSLALRAFSLFHSLTRQVAMETLGDLYDLPHRHPQKQPRDLEQYNTFDGVPYDVPNPSPPQWIEEQRILQALFQLRSCALLGAAVDRPDTSTGNLSSERFSMTHECRSLFRAHLQTILRAPASARLDWQAPASAPSPGDPANIHWAEDTAASFTDPTRGWRTFHHNCCIDRPSPFKKDDWQVFGQLGMAVWSYRRLAEELQLMNFPFALDEAGDGPETNKHMMRGEITFTWWIIYKAVQGRSGTA
ncbi:hypothetical protein LTS10_009202 [Elasticomyces elasticus]|nr:hypothetical protein LTS10_009202 [Elasticomyces elasticus]